MEGKQEGERLTGRTSTNVHLLINSVALIIVIVSVAKRVNSTYKSLIENVPPVRIRSLSKLQAQLTNKIGSAYLVEIDSRFDINKILRAKEAMLLSSKFSLRCEDIVEEVSPVQNDVRLSIGL